MAGIRTYPRIASMALLAQVACWSFLAANSAEAQERHRSPVPGYYQPLNQSTPPGMTGRFYATAGRIHPIEQQTIRVQLPSTGTVTFFTPNPRDTIHLDSPALATLHLGHIYRCRIADMPEFPGIELYPSIELIDRLHPPQGRETLFPVPVEFSEREIEAALDGSFVTKVVYLEQPQLSPIRPEGVDVPTADIPNTINLFAEADLRGRPMLILRLGSRLPDPNGAHGAFFGTSSKQFAPRVPAGVKVPATSSNEAAANRQDAISRIPARRPQR